ncbi:MAG: helix-hairpin-helix domain-containing protein [Candidatus Thermoplasmatota archaeon]|nr:helix-hairpin-helix domain-containing protein [Candidatus Thermoplasmatota archaeon]
MASPVSRGARVLQVTQVKRQLCTIPNVGPATAGDLIRLGIERIEDLADEDPEELYRRLVVMDGHPHDPCVRDVFAAAVAFARDGVVKPWWHYTKLRKARERA